MEYDKAEKLSNKLIQDYWDQFKLGKTWNYYSWPARYVDGDTWAKKSDWLEHSIEAFECKSNIIQSLEILLCEKNDQYINSAEQVVSEWYQGGAHDAYYYYEILARLPQDNLIRKSILSENLFDELVNDNETDNVLARRALIKIKDPNFCDYLGKHLNDSISSLSLSDDDLENKVIPVLIDFGRLTEEYVSQSNIDLIKDLFRKYLNNDRQVIDRVLGSGHVDKDERQVWIGDDIAYWAWSLGWNEFLQDLKDEDWYWVSLFSEWWDDNDNNNLLVWSLYNDDEILRKQAINVMLNHEYHKLDGAIAWSRLKGK